MARAEGESAKVKTHPCKLHKGAHGYTRCACEHEFCRDYWASCPRCHVAPAPFVDVSTISEYGLTQKLSNAIRVF